MSSTQRPPGSRSDEYAKLNTSARDAKHRRETGRIVIEEPLEIRLSGEPIAVTMRTPGHDIELALGFLFSENIVGDADEIISIAHCDENGNVVEAHVDPDAQQVHPPAQRAFFANSSCGVCGKASIEAVRLHTPSVADDTTHIAPELLTRLASGLRELQPLFRETGSLHAAALFDPAGHALCAREDVGRHNAVDKLIGWALSEGFGDLAGHLMLVSGRCGFEIVQKTLMARLPILASVSGPSSLALDLARDSGMTLVGFLRDDEMNIYTGGQRLS
ncbi:MAG: formate dehydrogenase accessory sulfurtransferase FdhD [bacterium]|nr:formate dehydrogenase accessory sulfurtransferase FdhD [bacterium]